MPLNHQGVILPKLRVPLEDPESARPELNSWVHVVVSLVPVLDRWRTYARHGCNFFLAYTQG